MVTGIIMASGYSKRMGRDKLLLEFNNTRLIEYIIRAALRSKLDDVILVYRKEEVGRIGKKHGLRCLLNENAHLGQAESIKLGVKNSKNGSYMFLLGDQPFVTHSLINSLIERHGQDTEKIVGSSYMGQISPPLIFPRKFKEELLLIKGNRGGREIVEKNQCLLEQFHVDSCKILKDIDTVEEYKFWKSSLY